MSTVRSRVAAALKDHERVLLWGASSFANTALGNWLPRSKIVRVVDSDHDKNGQLFHGIRVESPAEVDFSDIQCVVICVTAHLEVAAELDRRGISLPRHYIFDLMADGSRELSERQCLAVDYQLVKRGNIFRTLIERPQFWANITYRLSRHFKSTGWSAPVHYLVRFLHSVVMTVTSIELPHSVPAGPGLLLAHLGGLVVHDRATLGSFVTLYQFVTIGTNDSGHVPVIGDHVVVYSGACVLGRSHVGDYCRVGANAVVLDLECPTGTTLVGAPARVANRFSAPTAEDSGDVT